ncbi:hypothetical protein [Azohydromonas australica]|uniref:hypothetical protein n=1 Tax=Azohydromonas australica TaxID=364039 RepID=UPI0003FD6D38|nr:hypothetical protein [Azohydromonas australica]
MRRTGTPYQVELRLRSAAGDYRWFLVRAQLLHDAGGHGARRFAVATDIHEQRVARELLERQVQQRTAELQLASAREHAIVASAGSAVLLDVADAAVAWWQARKPADWSLEQHLAYPAINCDGDAERQLAEAVAKWMELKK